MLSTSEAKNTNETLASVTENCPSNSELKPAPRENKVSVGAFSSTFPNDRQTAGNTTGYTSS